jgi:plasmid stabilization system protein ParE
LAAARAVATILAAADGLSLFPNRGRAALEDGYRELPVKYSGSGYLVLYQVKPDIVRIIRVRHMREAGY